MIDIENADIDPNSVCYPRNLLEKEMKIDTQDIIIWWNKIKNFVIDQDYQISLKNG